MRKLPSLLATILILGCFVLNNYTIYEALTMPYRAGGYPIPAHLGMSSNLTMSLFGGVFAGVFSSLILGGISRLIARFSKDKKRFSRILYCSFAVLLACWTLSRSGNRTVLVTTASERMENFKNSGWIEALESRGLYEKE